jgi:hypothetical protein
MRASRRAIPALLAALAASCGRPAGRDATPTPPAAPTAVPLLASGIPLVPGLVLTLVPNLPGVDGEDMSDLARREVKVLEVEKGRLRLRWTGQVRVEKPESARRREDWVRARSNAPRDATPGPTVPAVYETREVGGTLDFPDFARASEFLLPGLWPEGNATIRGSTALWISPNALAELKGGGRASVPLAASAPSLREPAVTVLRRAIDLAARAPSGRPGLWSAEAPSVFGLRVDGDDVTVRALKARDWFGAYTVQDAGASPLVLAALPQPSSSLPADLFAPANVLRSLLGYRIAEVTRPKDGR